MTRSNRHVLIGSAPAIQRVRALIERIAPTPLPVLIHGETGTGKEIVAASIHAASTRSGPLVALNASAIPESMFESTLFGHVRGAFTGATGSAAGYLAEAHRGTLFLDEISSMALPAQAKLLRAIETRSFRPVGASEDRRSDFRVVAATNEDLDGLVETGRFRRDLLERLRGVRLHVPPLRARREDIPALTAHFLAGVAPGSTGTATIDPAAMELLIAHDWPGNVRELRRAVECAAAMADGGCIGVADVAPQLSTPLSAGGVFSVQGHERHHLLTILRLNGGDVDAAASTLGVHRATIYRWIKRLELDGVVRPAEGRSALLA
ncbi:MAG: sigma 54-interacting transcriptional regulator [Gemmatimonadaceae bacterium]|nr:sigma 54-interacting transcriptional regulator [Gemmatimonadaceae bacterium]